MNYCFTITKHSDPEFKLEDIEYSEYDIFFRLLEEMNIQLVYRFEHLGGEASHYAHKHYHGVLFSKKSITYKDLMIEGFSIRFEDKDICLMTWFNYCKHELNDRIFELENRETTEKAKYFVDKVFEKAEQACERKQTKIKYKKKSDTLFKITIY